MHIEERKTLYDGIESSQFCNRFGGGTVGELQRGRKVRHRTDLSQQSSCFELDGQTQPSFVGNQKGKSLCGENIEVS